MLGGKDLALITVSHDIHVFDIEIVAEELVTLQMRASAEGMPFEDFVWENILGSNPLRLLAGPGERPFRARIVNWRIELPEPVKDRLRAIA